ncbi:MAG: hypothetical protein QME52_11495, partial [Bacteroidota bacterium]|nr:hypothetical protein [Bacteroidota bacterium]
MNEKKEFLLKMYDTIWQSVRSRETTLIQYLGIIITALGPFTYSLTHDHRYLFATSILAELLMLRKMTKIGIFNELTQ